YAAESIRRATGIVMQDNFVFSDTIERNIILGEAKSSHRLHEAIETACLSDYIKELPLGVNTKIGSDGNGVSGGERQRIMIARAVYKRPQYMMMDEATSSLDAENERRITENLNREFKGRTMLVIAHRLSTVKNADNIIVLKHGKVMEQGTHEELVKARGNYYELVKNQLELEK
ncbi:MAG: ATP-binding cassette domain-containing protein, partial [Bacteroidaceae bacterium]